MDKFIDFQPKQWQLLEKLEASGLHVPTKLGFGGSRGGGKSGFIRRAMTKRRLDNPGTVGFIMRRHFGDLEENHIAKFRLEFPELSEFWRQSDCEYRFKNGSRIAFKYGDTHRDVEEMSRGPECMDLFVDQAEQFSETELTLLDGCNRWPGAGPGVAKKVLFYNPGGQGSEYLRRVFWLREFRQNENPGDFAFIHSFGWDNYEWFRGQVELSQRDFYRLSDDERFNIFIEQTSYGKSLNSLPPHQRLGELLGSFEHFSGQYFAGAWDEEANVLNPETEARLIKPWWVRWMSQDWAFAEHACHLWLATGKLSPADLLDCFGCISPAPMDIVVVYRQHIAQERAEVDLASDVVGMTPEHERRYIKRFFLSQDAFGQRAKQVGGNTVGDQFARIMERYKLPNPEPADQDRVNGHRFIYSCLRQAQAIRSGRIDAERTKQGPALFVSTNCPDVISAVPSAIRDPKNKDDCMRVEGALWEDVVDALRYGCKSMLDSKKVPPVEVRRQMVYDSVQDPTDKHIRMLEFERANKPRGTNRQQRWR